MNLELLRDPFNALAPCTMGTMNIGRGWPTLQTIERQWNENKGDIAGTPSEEASCVYPGVYELYWFTRPDGTECVGLLNPELDVYKFKEDIPKHKIDDGLGRYLILIHPGNYERNVIGCIAPGMGRAWEESKETGERQQMVTQSRLAFGYLMKALKESEGPHFIDIRQVGAPHKFE